MGKGDRTGHRRQEDHGARRQQFHAHGPLFYILEGRGQIIAEGTTYDIGAGSVARFLKGETHTVVNPGPGPLTLIEVRVLPRDQAVWE